MEVCNDPSGNLNGTRGGTFTPGLVPRPETSTFCGQATTRYVIVRSRSGEPGPSQAGMDRIALCLDFDMVGSPHHVFFVHDGGGSDDRAFIRNMIPVCRFATDGWALRAAGCTTQSWARVSERAKVYETPMPSEPPPFLRTSELASLAAPCTVS